MLELNVNFVDRQLAASILQNLGVTTPSVLYESVRDLARTLRTVVQGRTPVGVGKTQGTAKRSWTPVTLGDRQAEFGNTVPYAPPLEFGSAPGARPWPRVGPRTTLHEGRIYSRQAPGGMVGPAMADIDWEKVADSIAKQIYALWGSS